MKHGQVKGGRTVLVTMPFAALDQPPLGIALLKACLEQESVECRAEDLHLTYADVVGEDIYQRVLDLPFTSFAGEWVFADALYGASTERPDGYVDQVLRGTWQLGGEDVDALRFARDRAEGFLQRAEREVPWGDYRVVGFTSFFAQNLAALALARRIKEQHPRVLIVFGGYNWHGAMGLRLLRSFPFVDAACVGEGDVALPRYVRQVASGDDPSPDCGLVLQGSLRVPDVSQVAVADLDDLPLPDYRDSTEVQASRGPSRLVLSVETSRGCWWATKHPCRFCGLTGTLRTYRSKTPERILREFRAIAARPGCSLLEVVDNVVSPAFLRTVLPELAEHPLPVPLFFEMRPEATREDIRTIARAGAMVQIGIESLSDDALGLMGKGTTALQNVRLLRWCAEERVKVSWNVIYDIPGDRWDTYGLMVVMLPGLHHLQPPNGCSRMSLDRFSPFFEQAERYGIGDVRPLAPFRYLYPFDEATVMEIASAFDYETPRQASRDRSQWELRQTVSAWRREWRPGDLRVAETPSGNVRLTSSRREVELDDLDSALYRALEDIGSIADLSDRSPEAALAGRKEVEARLEALVADRVVVRVGEEYLSLGLFSREPAVT